MGKIYALLLFLGQAALADDGLKLTGVLFDGAKPPISGEPLGLSVSLPSTPLGAGRTGLHPAPKWWGDLELETGIIAGGPGSSKLGVMPYVTVAKGWESSPGAKLHWRFLAKGGVAAPHINLFPAEEPTLAADLDVIAENISGNTGAGDSSSAFSDAGRYMSYSGSSAAEPIFWASVLAELAKSFKLAGPVHFGVSASVIADAVSGRMPAFNVRATEPKPPSSSDPAEIEAYNEAYAAYEAELNRKITVLYPNFQSDISMGFMFRHPEIPIALIAAFGDAQNLGVVEAHPFRTIWGYRGGYNEIKPAFEHAPHYGGGLLASLPDHPETALDVRFTSVFKELSLEQKFSAMISAIVAGREAELYFRYHWEKGSGIEFSRTGGEAGTSYEIAPWLKIAASGSWDTVEMGPAKVHESGFMLSAEGVLGPTPAWVKPKSVVGYYHTTTPPLDRSEVTEAYRTFDSAFRALATKTGADPSKEGLFFSNFINADPFQRAAMVESFCTYFGKEYAETCSWLSDNLPAISAILTLESSERLLSGMAMRIGRNALRDFMVSEGYTERDALALSAIAGRRLSPVPGLISADETLFKNWLLFQIGGALEIPYTCVAGEPCEISRDQILTSLGGALSPDLESAIASGYWGNAQEMADFLIEYIYQLARIEVNREIIEMLLVGEKLNKLMASGGKKSYEVSYDALLKVFSDVR
ncbi:MAG: hypothetical protein HYT79_07035 [Elusimicrobia bacterium]|nr:hypothetical protein [Elusimicrobiota bacterium]